MTEPNASRQWTKRKFRPALRGNKPAWLDRPWPDDRPHQPITLVQHEPGDRFLEVRNGREGMCWEDGHDARHLLARARECARELTGHSPKSIRVRRAH